MLAFVTGATGFLGLNLIEQLEQLGWDVVALHRRSSVLTDLQRFAARRVIGEIDDLDSIERAMPERADAVFHTAADLSSWSRNNERQTRTNILGTRNVVAVALKRGAKKFIHTSTSSVYGLITTAIDETAPHLGRGAWINYMHTKTLAEDEVRQGIGQGLDAVIMNPSHVLGRYDRRNWSRLILLAAEDRLPRIPPGKGSFCHGSEVARAHIAAVSLGRCGENYLLAGADATFQEVVKTVAELIGQKTESRTVPAPILRALAMFLDFASRFTGREPLVTPEEAALLSIEETFRSDKAERELGYRRVPLRVMLKDCCDWLQSEGLLKRATS
jgi:dihydroflavonol-4-reductase